jgi:hypothetical protein
LTLEFNDLGMGKAIHCFHGSIRVWVDEGVLNIWSFKAV